MRVRTEQLTIGRLARAAEVGIETVRYYQSIGLLPVPESSGAYRYYPASLVDRIRFVKRGQQLGLSLTEIAELIRLNDGAHRSSIRQIAKHRLEEIEHRIEDLEKIRTALATLVNRCARTRSTLPCPIIESLMSEPAEPPLHCDARIKRHEIQTPHVKKPKQRSRSPA